MAGGILNPQIAGLIQILFRGRERGRAFGALGATIGIATAAGPLAGGALISLAGTEEGWRWVFYVNVPVGLIALPPAWRLLPAPGPGRRRESLDPVGVLLLGVGVVGLLLPFVQDQQWHGSQKWLLVPASLAVLAGFFGWEPGRRWAGGWSPGSAGRWSRARRTGRCQVLMGAGGVDPSPEAGGVAGDPSAR